MNSFGNRLKTLESVLDLNPDAMAELGGCSRSTYYRYRSGKSVPDLNFIHNILKNETKISADWLFKGTGQVLKLPFKQNPNGTRVFIQNSGECVIYPLPFLQMRSEGGGEGLLTTEDWRSPNAVFPVCDIMIDELIGAEEPEKMVVISIQCDSMAPEIGPGSLILVDANQSALTEDAIYMVHFDQVIRMKLVEKLPGNRIRLSTLNNKFQPVVLNEQETEQIRIVGRVVWTGKTL